MKWLAMSLAMATAAAVAADQHPGRAVDRPMTKQEARFRALDVNNDQQLSPQEFRVDATSLTEFTKLDSDTDGFLSLAEFVARPIPRAKAPSD
jgi:hypothetical protein